MRIEHRGAATRLVKHQLVLCASLFVLSFGSGRIASLGVDQTASFGRPVSATQIPGPAITPLGDGAVAVSPEGWRRTRTGWQHTDQWDREPTRSMRTEIETLKNARHGAAIMASVNPLVTHPITFVIVQLGCLFVVHRYGRRRERLSQ